MEITKDEMQKRSNITKKKPVNNNNNDSNDKIKSSNTFVVSDVSDGIVTLVSNCLHVLDFPLSLLPFDVQKGQILQLDISRAVDVEKRCDESFKSLQNDLLVASMSR